MLNFLVCTDINFWAFAVHNFIWFAVWSCYLFWFLSDSGHEILIHHDIRDWSKTPWLSGIMNDSKAIFKAFVSSNHGVKVRIYSYVTHRLTSASIQKSTSPVVPLASTVVRLFGRGTGFQFHAFSALVVLDYSYCCPDCGVRIELACLV